MEKEMQVLEIFNSHQGEIYQGLYTTFLRFRRCHKPFNEDLCEFCDTMTKMTEHEEYTISYDKILNYITNANNNIIFTGGEPTMYVEEIKNFLIYCQTKGIIINYLGIETNGYNLLEFYRMIKDFKDVVYKRLVISYCPKILGSKHTEKYNEVHKIFSEEIDNYDLYLKFLIDTFKIKDCELLLRTSILPYFKNDRIWLMPMGRNSTEILLNASYVSDLASRYRVNVSGRLHILFNFS